MCQPVLLRSFEMDDFAGIRTKPQTVMIRHLEETKYRILNSY